MKVPYYLFALLLMTACNQSQRESQVQEKQAQTRLLKVHDRIMPEMELIVHKESELKVALTKMRLDKQHNPGLDTMASSKKINASLDRLKSADDSMMNWMDKLDLDFSQKTHKQIMAYLSLNYMQVQRIDSAVNIALDKTGVTTSK